MCFVVAARITPGVPRRLSLDQDSGLMLRVRVTVIIKHGCMESTSGLGLL